MFNKGSKLEPCSFPFKGNSVGNVECVKMFYILAWFYVDLFHDIGWHLSMDSWILEHGIFFFPL